jgi:SnoaL-like domain
MTDQEKLQMLFDRVQIGEAIHRYPVSIDSRDWKLFRSIFTDEIQVYLGPRPTSST